MSRTSGEVQRQSLLCSTAPILVEHPKLRGWTSHRHLGPKIEWGFRYSQKVCHENFDPCVRALHMKLLVPGHKYPKTGIKEIWENICACLSAHTNDHPPFSGTYGLRQVLVLKNGKVAELQHRVAVYGIRGI